MRYTEWLEELDIVMHDEGDESKIDLTLCRQQWRNYEQREFYDELVARDPEAETIDLRYEL